MSRRNICIIKNLKIHFIDLFKQKICKESAVLKIFNSFMPESKNCVLEEYTNVSQTAIHRWVNKSCSLLSLRFIKQEWCCFQWMGTRDETAMISTQMNMGCVTFTVSRCLVCYPVVFFNT